MKTFSLPNLRAKQLVELPPPWEHKPKPARAINKDAYRAWCNDPATNFQFYSLAEGTHPQMRVARTNPVARLHGLVADYDCTITDDMVKSVEERWGAFKPAWIGRTFSGGARVVWGFEDGVGIHPAMVGRFMAKAMQEVGAQSLFPGLDVGAWPRLEQYYASGPTWIKASDDLIPTKHVWLWLQEAGVQVPWEGPNVELAAVAAEIERQHPGAWKGPFEVGARGTPFWTDIDSDSVVVGNKGFICFDTRVGESFIPWEKVLGRKWVRDQVAGRIGSAIEDLWCDENKYYERGADGKWLTQSAERIKRTLTVDYLMSSKKNGGTASELDEALRMIEQQKRVAGLAPFLYCPNAITTYHGETYLNDNRAFPVRPLECDVPPAWGEGFPWLANFIGRLFVDGPRENFLAWLQHAYGPALQGEPVKGQPIFITGHVHCGKSLLAMEVVGGLLGGGLKANKPLLADESFNRELLYAPVWVIDDPLINSRLVHERWTNLVKTTATSSSQRFHKKYDDAKELPWLGRLVVTCNEDASSIAILPDLDANILDKICIYKTSPDAITKFEKTDVELASIIRDELPAFGAWLLGWEPPPHVFDGSRFNVKSYHDPEVIELAGCRDTLGELVEAWIEDFFAERSDDSYELSATDMFGMIRGHERLGRALGGASVVWFARALNTKISDGWAFVERSGKHQKTRRQLYRIWRLEAADNKEAA